VRGCRGARLALLCAAVAFGPSGCGGGESHGKPVSARVVAQAAAKTTAASRVRVSTIVAASANGESVGDGSRSGVVDGLHNRGRIKFDLAFLAVPGSPLDPNDLRGEVVYYGDDVFVNTPHVMEKLPKGKRWIELTREQARGAGGGTGLEGLATLDPTKPVDHLRAAEGEAELLGTGQVRGVPAKHYRVTLDYRRYVPLLPPRDQAGYRKTLDRLEQVLGTSKLPIEVWIASDGTIRRLEGEVSSHGSKLTYTVDISAIGKAERVHPPPRAQVIDGRGI
jgi:hypothetical protein